MEHNFVAHWETDECLWYAGAGYIDAASGIVILIVCAATKAELIKRIEEILIESSATYTLTYE